MTEYKPGDVAMLTLRTRGGKRLPAMFVDPPAQGLYCWHLFGNKTPGIGEGAVTKAEPLLIIDPEDRENLNAIVRAVWPGSGSASAGRLKDVLRSRLAPRPEEPTGLGAVVEDSDGSLWINWRDPRSVGVHERPWVLVHDSHTSREWEDITVVREHSPGARFDG